MGNVAKGKSVIQSYKALEAACADLRYEVEHQGSSSPIVLLGATYRATDPNAIKTLTMDGIEVGYQLKHVKAGRFIRCIYAKVPGYRWGEIPKPDTDRILAAVMDGCLDHQKDTRIELIAPDCFLIAQFFEVAYQVERNPDLRSIAGGVNLDKEGNIVQ